MSIVLRLKTLQRQHVERERDRIDRVAVLKRIIDAKTPSQRAQALAEAQKRWRW